MLHFGVVLREGDYVVVGRDGLQVGFVGRHISPEGLFGHLTTAMSLRNGGGTGLLGSFASYMFSAYALIWTLDGFRATERASCVIALLGLR